MKQSKVERRIILRRLWKDVGKTFLIIYAIALLIIIVLPLTRGSALAYFVAFLLSFGISFFLLFFKSKEKPAEFESADR